MKYNPTPTQVAWIKAIVFALCLIPFGRLLWAFYTDNLGANPIEYITRATSWWTLGFLVITLTVTPLRKLLSWPWLLRLRRMLGLFAFFYVLLHFTTYIWLDQEFEVASVIKDVIKRPFITVGFTAFLMLIPLAVTSTNAMVKRLGAKRWQALHRAVYVIVTLGVTHYWWLVKKDITEPVIFAAIVAALFLVRLVYRWKESKAKPKSQVQPRAATRVA